MKRKFTEGQIVAAIKKQENGMAGKDICRELSISDATFYNLKLNLKLGLKVENLHHNPHPLLNKNAEKQCGSAFQHFISREDRIRTCDPLVPNQVFYRPELPPEFLPESLFFRKGSKSKGLTYITQQI